MNYIKLATAKRIVLFIYLFVIQFWKNASLQTKVCEKNLGGIKTNAETSKVNGPSVMNGPQKNITLPDEQ